MRVSPNLAFAAALALAGCAKPLPVSHFAGTAPAFDPVRFWTGHTRSWGVIETRDGAPSDTVETDCLGTPEGTGLHMVQTITEGDGTVTHRDWHLRRTGPGRYAATANDMRGEALGEAAGRAFHWRWVWARPGGDLTLSQWMYAYPDGTMMNRTVLTKFGVVVAEVSERFERAG